MAGRPTACSGSRRSSRPDPNPRELDVIAATGEQVTIGLLAIALRRAGPQGEELHRRPGAHPDRQRVHQGAHPRRSTRRRCAPISTAGTIVIVAGFQGVDADGNITTLGPRRLGHVGRRARRGAQGRRMPDLHRRRRRLHDRSAHRARGAAARHASPSRKCSRWRASARRCCRSARSNSPGKYKVKLRVLSSFDDPESTRAAARSSRSRKTRPWNRRSFPASRSTATKPRSR